VGVRPVVAVFLLVGTSALGTGCQAPSEEAIGTARTSPAARASEQPSARATPPPRDARTAQPSASASAAIVSPGPAISIRKSPSKLQGFDVYESDGLTVSLKSYYVDNVYDRKEAPYPACPRQDVITRQKGTIEPLDGPEHSIVFYVGSRYGAMTTGSYPEKGEYGHNAVCCISGDEIAASSLRPTLTRDEAVRSAAICRRLMSRDAL
jgi:hypothetical protein